MPAPRASAAMSRFLLCVVLAAACACARTPASAPEVARTPTPLDPATTGTIEGEVRFEGTPPAPRTVDLDSDPTCAAAHPDGLVVRDVRVADGRLADAFVYIAAGLEDRVFAVPDTPVVIDQRGCWYDPRVAGAQVGQAIQFRSSDDTLHNVHALAETNDAFNLGMPKKGMRVTRRFDRPEVMVKVKCDVHGWMASYAGVVSHPYFAVSARDGAFSIRNLPAGSYTLEAWHEKLGTQTLSVTIGEKETKSVGFTFRAGA